MITKQHVKNGLILVKVLLVTAELSLLKLWGEYAILPLVSLPLPAPRPLPALTHEHGSTLHSQHSSCRLLLHGQG